MNSDTKVNIVFGKTTKLPNKSTEYDLTFLKINVQCMDLEILCSYYLKKGIKKYPNYKYFDGERKKLFSYLKRYGFNDKMIEEVLKEVNIDENAT